MNRRDGRRFFLGFQWDACSWEHAAVWLDVLARRLDGFSVHWNLPAFPADIPARRRLTIAKPLQARIADAGDIVTSLGFAGACHPVLTLEEMEKELAWGVRNPWGSGVTDVLGARPAVAIPRVVDTARTAAWKLYVEGAFRGLGICVDPVPEAPPPRGCFYCARVIVPPRGPLDAVARAVRRAVASRDRLFLLFDLSTITDADSLQHALDGLIAPVLSGHARPAHLDPPGDGVQPEPPGPAVPCDWRPLHAPLLRERLDAASTIARRKRRKNEDYQEILGRLSATSPLPAPAVAAGDDGKNTQIVAHMLGEVTLAGSDFDVRLVGGRFSGARGRDRALMPRRQAVSYLRTAGRTHYYRTISSFSFENDEGTGLREELALDEGEGASIRVEYSFCADCPLLSVSVEISYPSLAFDVDEYAPFAIAVREMKRGDSALIEVTAPDDSASTLTMTDGSRPVTCAGAGFRVRRADGGWIVLRFGTADTRRWGLAAFRVARTRGMRVLEVNPFGSYAAVPAAALSGRRESYSLLLGAEEA